MAKYIGGTAMVIQWIDASGTITIQNQYTKFTTPWSADMVEVSSGSTTAKQYLPTLTDMTITYEGFSNGKSSPLGTSDMARLEPRAGGTLIWAPFGTSSGNPKGGVFAYVKKADLDYPFANAVTCSIDWQGSDVLLFDPNVNVF